jgi:hypothetical protein
MMWYHYFFFLASIVLLIPPVSTQNNNNNNNNIWSTDSGEKILSSVNALGSLHKGFSVQSHTPIPSYSSDNPETTENGLAQTITKDSLPQTSSHVMAAFKAALAEGKHGFLQYELHE